MAPQGAGVGGGVNQGCRQVLTQAMAIIVHKRVRVRVRENRLKRK